ncbi:MAG: hypothetical protein OXD44_02420 [Gammaproteobacteria bacterium]|nr:hypothetical protein [Gammaproteobacteria bacterium]MCY4312545.1 hypothetical protein [Gammaproteobacteria bacterium]
MLDQAQLNAAEGNIIAEFNGGLQNVKNALNPIDKYLVSTLLCAGRVNLIAQRLRLSVEHSMNMQS